MFLDHPASTNHTIKGKNFQNYLLQYFPNIRVENISPHLDTKSFELENKLDIEDIMPIVGGCTK